MRTVKANDYVEYALVAKNQELGKRFDANAIAIRSPIRLGLDNVVRVAIEDLVENNKTKVERLVVLLETGGGFIEVVERIYAVIRKHYSHVEFVVPNYAYSAGTVLVLSGDVIHMDYYSVLGPIDPQIENNDGKSVPGLGYLAKFDELVKRINSSDSKTSAELAYLISRFDPATLFLLEQAKNHSRSLLVSWLSRHKFKDWVTTQTTGRQVTPEMREKRAHEIADVLGNAERWHSHGRGIGMKELTSDEIKLKINDFGADEELNVLVRNYHDLFTDFSVRLGYKSAIHTELGLRGI